MAGQCAFAARVAARCRRPIHNITLETPTVDGRTDGRMDGRPPEHEEAVYSTTALLTHSVAHSTFLS